MFNERGIALPMTMIVMVLVASLGMALVGLAMTEPGISRNLQTGTQARLAAEAGLEWGFNTLVSTTNWDSLLTSANANAGVLLASSTIPGLTNTHGLYSVNLRNDTQVGDPALTGVAVDASAVLDTNGAVILTSAGTLGTATRTVQVVVKRPPSLPFPGAVVFPGNEAQTSFSNDSFEISGHGWKMNGTSDAGCASVYGISTNAAIPTNETVVENSLSATQKDNVKGKKQNTSLAGDGNNTIAGNPALTPAIVKAFIDDAKKNADVVLESKQATGGLSYANVGSTCASDWNSSTCWGTADKPKIVWVKGEEDKTSNFNALKVTGTTTGYGILIVEDGDFRIYDNFQWYGPIIVTGKYVGVGFLGGGTQTVYGALISNETESDPGYMEGVVTGNATIRYSCEALDKALGIRRLVSTRSWREVAP